MKPLQTQHIAIVGCGPRGLASLEFLMKHVALHTKKPIISIHMFDSEPYPGAGNVWHPEQAATNRLNSSDRSLQKMEGRSSITFSTFEIPAFPSFIEWMQTNHQHTLDDELDAFLPRKLMGSYLHLRYQSIANVLIQHNLLTVITSEVKDLQYRAPHFMITDSDGNEYSCEECLLTVGHQPVFDSEEIKTWKWHDEVSEATFIAHPYYNEIQKQIDKEDRVGIRGFGLAMIDVVRMLTVGRGGFFSETNDPLVLTYTPSEASVSKIVAFSLDGLPLVPKPVGYHVDRYFIPSEAQQGIFEKDLENLLKKVNENEVVDVLLKIVSNIAAEHYLKHPTVHATTPLEIIETSCVAWLKDPTTSHELILTTHMPPVAYMKAVASMALGNRAITLDYCIGNVWRHLQPILYRVLSHSTLSPSIMETLIDIDENTKRYSFGPPVASTLELIALAEAGILDLRFVNDPKITCEPSGWKLVANEEETRINCMVNSVLAPPQLKKNCSDLLVGLQNDGILQSVTPKLGAKTYKDGTVRTKAVSESLRLSVLGRNSLGSVIGVDSIRECFGERVEAWAKGAAERLYG
ncbi:FAD/NAD(P)-binding protein [Cochleicola gelatinilyticus]|uniref:FAD-dependent urate hydroxylase HpyO/Asp monooxygenase CreE-like FAD/NAD(P)-binding domain-containing protein n=1 Tax=Cochleicola gelatinilyticus TaxID=1763537 RepID=A0A167KG03_9FLAO|nr:FAD/NAD(P)-binding protein [Cochleicola gelatinilyticus]OAB81853.1 hypothetical protein ULVI_00520 [Cochleicola gelatinilyticus]